MLNAIEIGVGQCNDAFSVIFLRRTLRLEETYKRFSVYVLVYWTPSLFLYYTLTYLSYTLQASPSLVLLLQLPLFNRDYIEIFTMTFSAIPMNFYSREIYKSFSIALL